MNKTEVQNQMYNAIVSSDWNECLAPCGPFDCISFNYPQFTSELGTIFRQYTSNYISLGDASRQIQTLLPVAITIEQMDAYLDNSFSTYKGVPQLIQWCLSRDILFMINTTGMIGYFQRVFAKGLLPRVPVISAHPMVRFPSRNSDPDQIHDLFETSDKGKNTETVARRYHIPVRRIILMGDSGGDGPHFEWGANVNAFLIGSMTKPSLETYCLEKNIHIHVRFGISHTGVRPEDHQNETQFDFMDLASTIAEFLSQTE